MRVMPFAAAMALLVPALAHADVIKSFRTNVTFPTGSRYAIQIFGTTSIDLTTETFVAIDLTLSYIFNYTHYSSFTPYSTATDFGFTSVQDSPGLNPFVIGIEIGRSTLGTDPLQYAGGPVDPDRTAFGTLGFVTYPGTSDSGELIFIEGSTVVTPPSNVPEPASLGVFAAASVLAAGLYGRKGRRSDD